MPEDAPEQKVEATRGYGAEVVFYDRYRDDPVLGEFYRMVAESERHQIEWHKRAFRDEDELD